MRQTPPALWADFNEADEDRIWTWIGNTPFRLDGFPSVGQVVELWNEEGVFCLAVVERIDSEIAYLRLLRDTYREVPAVYVYSQPRFTSDARADVAINKETATRATG